MCINEMGPHPAKDKRATIRNNVDNLLGQFDFVKLQNTEKSEIFENYYRKYTLHREAQRLIREIYPRGNNYTKCTVCPFDSTVAVVRSAELRRAYFRQVITCANASLCPVCAPRIRAKRTEEIGKAFDQWKKADSENTIYMITLTFQHQKTDSLSVIMENLKNASKSFWGHWSVKNAFKSAGMVGRITAFEITYGSNGWHPHYHIVVFCKRSQFNVDGFKKQWLQALGRSNLSGSDKCAFNFIEARDGSEYLSKISLELGLSTNKAGRRGGLSPFELLQKSVNGERWAGERFKELWVYLHDSRTRSLLWSKGLKDYFQINEVSDEEICMQQDEKYKVYTLLHSGIYRLLSVEDKAEILSFASVDDRQGFLRYLVRFCLRMGVRP